MNEQCKKCHYYSGDNVLLPHCFHINSAIAPGWDKYYEDKDCPEFVDKERKYNELKDFFEKNIDNFIQEEIKDINDKFKTDEKTQDESNEYIVVHGEPSLEHNTENLIAKINFIDSYYGNLFLDSIKQGQKLVIKPYGHAEHDDDGKVKNFNLIGFNICSEK